MRTFRTARPVRLLAATGVAVAALALTACDNGMGPRDEGRASDSNSTSQTTGSTGTGTTGGTGSTDTASTTGGTTTTDKASARTGTGTSKAAASDPWDPANRVTCNGSNTTVTMKPVARPLNHMLITVKNTGSKYCDLYYNPTVRFDQAQWAPGVFEESQPQAVVTLAPGESGYAGVLLASADGSGENGTTARKVTIGFQGKEPGSNGGRVAAPALPSGGVYYDSSLTVTYWQSSIDDALMY
ncbi:DUF4232 domain-containing protein [Streptomyces sp. NBC_00481]|uniref:DUF4232 domain-containing protein n=1 Tax=unclassified Streptomyces TaxID=2593676 RepID=UPI002DDB4CD6|nr:MULTISPECIES: DUF4232 domain-containing protein [unclassified Streptomyces]WRZ01479.1 DUF4232 domain-containing protein [Streptomyces sp. NBC_00481]